MSSLASVGLAIHEEDVWESDVHNLQFKWTPGDKVFKKVGDDTTLQTRKECNHPSGKTLSIELKPTSLPTCAIPDNVSEQTYSEAGAASSSSYFSRFVA